MTHLFFPVHNGCGMDTTPTENTPETPVTQEVPPTAPEMNQPETPTPETPKARRSLLWPLLLVVGILVSLAAGFAIASFSPFTKPATQTPQQTVTIAEEERFTLPTEAVQIQACADHSGALYVLPENIPMGPVYMVHEGDVIGVKYMIPREELINGDNFNHLAAEGMEVDHVNIGIVQDGHVGMNDPHYHVSLYTVSEEVEQNIVCAPGTSENTMEMEGMHDATGSSRMMPGMTGTMTPSTTQQAMPTGMPNNTTPGNM